MRAPYQREVAVALGYAASGAPLPAREVDGVDVAVPRFNRVEGNVGAFRNVAYIIPVRAVIHRVVDLSIAADRPEHAFSNGGDGKVTDEWPRRGATASAGSSPRSR